MRCRWWVVAVAIGLFGSPVGAVDPPRAAAAWNWQALTKGDAEAAYQLLERNDPGAVPAVGDAHFRKQLSAGYRTALERAAQVTGYGGYSATMEGFANSLEDQHIWFRQVYQPISVQWAGLIAAKRGSHWIVADTDSPEQALKDAEIVSCDGRSPDDLGRERLGAFMADWRIPAQQIITSWRLLIDDGNPFVKRPDSCVFRTSGGTRTVKLNWRNIWQGDLTPHVQAVGDTLFGEAGFGVKSFESGTWIAIQGFGQKASQVLDEVRARLPEIKSSSLVVIDLRGNAGGNSEYGHELAQMLLGDAYVSSALGERSDCGSAWRASPDNLKTLMGYRAKADPALGADYVRYLDREIAKMKRALARGQPLSGPIRCKRTPEPEENRAGASWPAKFRLVVLTDSACFSSCLLVTDELRRLGAIQVGQPTNAATRYMEVREIELPSGLGFFSTLQEVDMSQPPQYGPFEPKYLYDGNIADTAAVQHWVAATVPH